MMISNISQEDVPKDLNIRWLSSELPAGPCPLRVRTHFRSQVVDEQAKTKLHKNTKGFVEVKIILHCLL